MCKTHIQKYAAKFKVCACVLRKSHLEHTKYLYIHLNLSCARGDGLSVCMSVPVKVVENAILQCSLKRSWV